MKLAHMSNRRRSIALVLLAAAVLILILIVDGEEAHSPLDRTARGAQSQADAEPALARPPEPIGDRVGILNDPSAVEGPPADESGVPRTHGTVTVRLTLDGGPAVTSGRVELKQSSFSPRAVDQQGRVVFEGVPFGEYWVRVDEDSLPEGVLAPGLQDRSVHGEVTGLYRTELVLAPDAPDIDVELALTYAAKVHGYVLGPAGEPIEHVFVMAQSTLHSGLNAHGFTDANGYYEFARVHPNTYWIQLTFDERYAYPQSPRGETYEDLSQAPQFPFEIASNEVVRKDVTLGGGNCTVRGIVVDQDGRPFPGLEVLAYYKNLPGDDLPRLTWGNRAGHAVTDDQGEYLLDGLFPEQLGIQIEPHGFRFGAKVGENLLGRWIEHTEVDLRSSCHVEAPDSVAHRSRPFRVFGRVQLDPEWAALQQVTPNRLEMTLLWPPREFPRGEEPEHGAMRRQERVDIERDGAYEWAVETPVSRMTVRVEAVWTDASPVEFEIEPIPDATVEVPIHFP